MEIVFILILIGVAVFYFMRRSTPATPLPKEDLLNKFLKRTLKSVADKYTSDVPDNPVGFGYKMNWLAIKSSEAKVIADDMGNGKTLYTTNWEQGIKGAYDGATFISPVVDGWVLVVNPLIGDFTDADDMNRLIKLSAKYGEVHFYGTHRVSSYAAWAKFINGSLVRGVSIGDYNVDYEEGQPRNEELQLMDEAKKAYSSEDLQNFAECGYITLLTNEEWVMKLAGLWSIDPTKLDDRSERGFGYIF